jgi:hypothetical protein
MRFTGCIYVIAFEWKIAHRMALMIHSDEDDVVEGDDTEAGDAFGFLFRCVFHAPTSSVTTFERRCANCGGANAVVAADGADRLDAEEEDEEVVLEDSAEEEDVANEEITVFRGAARRQVGVESSSSFSELGIATALYRVPMASIFSGAGTLLV